MKISIENQIRLKNMLRQKNKENELSLLTTEIESKEEKMLSNISKEYLKIIQKCNDLKNVKTKIPSILEQNENLVFQLRETSLKISEIEREIKDNELLDKKILELLDELGQLSKFFILINTQLDTSDKLYFYYLTTNLKQIKELVAHFKDYRAFDELYEIAMVYNKKADRETFKFLNEYKNRNYTEMCYIGEKIVKMSHKKHKIIFNDILSLRKKFITDKLLDILYLKDQQNLLDEFIDTLNLERKVYISNIQKNDDVMFYYIFEILNSYFLTKINQNFLDYYDFILECINEYLISTDILKYKDLLISVKDLMSLMSIDDVLLNETIGRISIEYFNRSNISNIENDRNKFREDIDTFINKSISFIDRLNNNEINEIFINKLDLYLKNLVNSSTPEEVIKDEKFIEDIKNKIHKIFPNNKLRSESFYNEKIADIKFNIVKSKMKEIDKIFNDQRNFNINLQNYMTRHREIYKELYEIIKIKFVEILNDCKDDTIENKRTMAGRTTCFYKYLQNADTSLADDFRKIHEEANKY